MASQESRLIISIDARNAEKTAKALNDELKKLQTGGNQASTAVKTLGDNANNQTGKLKNLGSGLKNLAAESTKFLAGVAGAATGAAVALGGLAVAYAQNVKEMQNMANLADANVVEFQRMAFAAERYGVSQEQLSDMLKDFNEKLGEFVLTGKGEATDAFELLNKHAKMSTEEISKFALEMQKASGPDALLMYVDRLEKAGVSQEQLSFLVENMGNDFTKLLPILTDGGAELKRLADEAQRLGVILDEEAVEQALELEKQIKKIQMQAQGATNQFMTGLIPAVSQMAGGFSDAAGQSDLLKQAGEDMGSVLKGVAAVAMGAYVAISSVARAITGAAKDAIDAKNAIDGNSKGWKNWVGPTGIKNLLFAGASVASGTGKNTSEALDKNAKSAESYTTFMDNLYKEQEEFVKKMNKGLGKIGTGNGVTTGLKTFADDMAKSNESAKKAQEKSNRDAERLADEIARIREQITYEYADREKQIEINLQKELADIRKAGMGDSYIDAASKRAYLEKQIYLSQLQYEINEFQMTEKQKLKYKTEINQLMIQADTSMTEENKKIRLKALDEEYKIEIAKIELAQQQRINSAREQFLDTTYAMQERYRLERAEIQLINGELERNFRLEMSRLAESTEARKRLMDAQTAWANTQAQMNGTSEYQGTFDTQNSRMTESQELFDAQMAMANSAEERLAIWQAYQDRLTQIEQAGAQARRDLTFAYAQSMVGGYTDMFKDMMGEQSSAYKVMFAVQKAFAIAQVLLNAPESYSKAYNAMVGLPIIGPAVAPAAGVAAVALQLAQAAQIKSVNLGFQTGGYTGNGGVSDVAGVVHGQEYVLNAEATKRVGRGTLDALNNGATLGGGVNVTIQNYGTSKAFEVQQLDANTVRIIARDEARNTVATDLQNPNSQISKAASQNLNALRRRG